MTHIVDARGFLIFGGLFLSTRGPLWRNDDAFYQKILTKISYVLDLAKEERLVPVITGNVFACPHESNDAMKTVLIRPKLRRNPLGQHSALSRRFYPPETSAPLLRRS